MAEKNKAPCYDWVDNIQIATLGFMATDYETALKKADEIIKENEVKYQKMKEKYEALEMKYIGQLEDQALRDREYDQLSGVAIAYHELCGEHEKLKTDNKYLKELVSGLSSAIDKLRAH